MDYHMNTRELLEIPEDAFVVGMVGRLAEQKAPDVFVKAAKRIKKKYQKLFFLLLEMDRIGMKCSRKLKTIN